MTEKLDDEELADKALQLIKSLSEQNSNIPTFTDDEIKALKPVALFIISARNIIPVFKYAFQAIKWAGCAIAVVLLYKSGMSISDIINAIGHIL